MLNTPSQTIIAGDYGYVLTVPVIVVGLLNLANASSLMLRIETACPVQPEPIFLALTAGIVTLEEAGITYPAGQWAYRTIIAGDFPESLSGTFESRVIYQDATSQISSASFLLTIAPE